MARTQEQIEEAIDQCQQTVAETKTALERLTDQLSKLEAKNPEDKRVPAMEAEIAELKKTLKEAQATLTKLSAAGPNENTNDEAPPAPPPPPPPPPAPPEYPRTASGLRKF